MNSTTLRKSYHLSGSARPEPQSTASQKPLADLVREDPRECDPRQGLGPEPVIYTFGVGFAVLIVVLGIMLFRAI